MEIFDIHKIEGILLKRKKEGFSGWPICLTEQEMISIIEELRKYREK